VAERSGGVSGVVKWSGEVEWWSGGAVEWDADAGLKSGVEEFSGGVEV
jgi:hypothetical protein